jgi:hypothetical protein
MKRTLTACAAITVAGIGVMVPAVAQGHEATGTVSCTAATIDFTKFPAGPQTAQWQLMVDQHLVATGSFDFQGPSATFTTPVSITDTAEHHLTLLSGWTTATPGEGAPMHEVASATVTCGTPPPPVVPVSPAVPPPAAAVTPAAPAVTPAGAQAGGAVSPAKRKTRRVPERCVLPTLGADIRGPKLIDAGKRVTVGVRVLNTSTAPARRVTATYPIPAGFSLAGTPHGGRMVNGALQVSLGNIGPHARKSLRISLRADRESSGLQRTRVSVNARGILNRTRRTAPATCDATAASTTAIRVLPVAARVQPAVTG